MNKGLTGSDTSTYENDNGIFISPLLYKATKSTPEVTFDPAENVFSISGRSMPNDARRYYNPIIEWVKGYCKSNSGKVVVQFELDYVSSSSSVFLLYIMNAFNVLNIDGGKTVRLVWRYRSDDEAMLETGMEYIELLGTTLQLEEYSS